MKYNNKQKHSEEVENSREDTRKKERSPRLGNSPEGVEAVDLGMPSGTKWASCNVGATKPEECGGYYAWGETEEKVNYTDVTYLYSRGEDIDLDGEYEEKERYKYLGPDISGTQYDVAHVKWGGDWRMPTLQQFKELLANCTSQWTSLNGKIGCKFISKINGSSIFFPAYRYLWGSEWEELRFEQIMKSNVLSAMIITDSKVPMVSFVCHRMGIAGVANVTITRPAIIIKGTVNTPSAFTGRPRRTRHMMITPTTSDSTRATLVGKATTAVSVNVSDQSSHYKKQILLLTTIALHPTRIRVIVIMEKTLEFHNGYMAATSHSRFQGFSNRPVFVG